MRTNEISYSEFEQLKEQARFLCPATRYATKLTATATGVTVKRTTGALML